MFVKSQNFRLLFFLQFVFTSGQILFAQNSMLFINEFQASNASTITDEFDEYDDWLEIYNAADTLFDIGGLFLSDDFSDLTKWRIPDSSSKTKIDSNGYLLLWADSDTSQGVLHLGFKLSADGEIIILTDRDGFTILDMIEYGEQYTDISFGREPDGSSGWSYFEEPTPGQSNDTTGLPQKAISPEFSIRGGFFSSPQNLTLSDPNGGNNIFYTLDGHEPSLSSNQYIEPILIDTTIIVRARVIRPGFLSSNIISNSYFYNKLHKFSTISLVSAPQNIWGSTGIYDNRYNDMEIPIHIEYFDENNYLALSTDGGLKIHSPDSRPQQSFRLYARNQYGAESFNYNLFEQKDLDTYKTLILRNGGNDGTQLTNGTILRDPFMHVLYYMCKNENEISAYRPVHVYLNGKYWGIYNLRERQDEDYIRLNHNFDGDIDFLERTFHFPGNRNAIEGDWNAYDNLEQYIEDFDLSETEHFNTVSNSMDIDNFSDYWLTEIFAGNFDWLSNNIKYWCPKNEPGKWRWVMWDMDHGLGLPHYSDGTNHGDVNWNTLDWATGITGDRVNEGANTLIIRGLLENTEYKNYFINRFADLLNTDFDSLNTEKLFNQLVSLLEPDIRLQLDRWNGSYSKWNENLGTVRNYLNKRPAKVFDHIIEKFELTGKYKLQTSTTPGSGGKINLNSIEISDSQWVGTYLNDIPITLKANPNPNYVFKKWDMDTSLVDSFYTSYDSIRINLSNNFFITAEFEIDSFPEIIINEINYKSSENFETEDWVELYNPRPYPIDLSGWIFKDGDDDHAFIIPAETSIKPDSFIVLCEDLDDFESFFPNTKNVIGDFDFGLDKNGEIVRLYNNENTLIDSLWYGSINPWPSAPNGQGFTLELINPLWDNQLAENWTSSSNIGGTPGKKNSQLTGVKQGDLQSTEKFSLSQNYPNPFNSTTSIKYTIQSNSFIELEIFNLAGQLISTLVKEKKKPGHYSALWIVNYQSTGVYFIALKADQKLVDVKKAVYIK